MSMNIENQICEPRTNHGETVVEQRGNNEQIVGQIQTGENEQENMILLWQQNRNFITMIARKYSSCAEMEDPSLGVSTIIFWSLFRLGTATVSINAGFFRFSKT